MGRLPSRRTFLVGGLGVGAAAVTGVLTDVLPGGRRLRDLLGLTGPDGEVPDVPAGPVTVERVRSAARGQDIDLVIMRPAGAPKRLPVCLALHGRGDRARSFVDMGIPRFLTAAVQNGARPFAVAAVDGGGTYFVARDEKDDPQRMLVEELPAWLDERGLPSPTTAFGISMGCFGALRFARTRQDLRAVAVISPALFRDWSEAKTRNAFRDEQQWAANEPLRHTNDLKGTTLGVWCGTDDPFVDAARELIDRTHPKVAAIGPGTHESGYFRRVTPDVMHFIGQSV
jgi:pimeloyl-ACP methyl ester carboxylesterase